MANPMMAKLMANKIGPIKQAFGMAQAMTNPNAMVNQLLSQNPQVRQLIQQHGGDAKQAFYATCQQMGVDPESILSQLK